VLRVFLRFQPKCVRFPAFQANVEGSTPFARFKTLSMPDGVFCCLSRHRQELRPIDSLARIANDCRTKPIPADGLLTLLLRPVFIDRRIICSVIFIVLGSGAAAPEVFRRPCKIKDARSCMYSSSTASQCDASGTLPHGARRLPSPASCRRCAEARESPPVVPNHGVLDTCLRQIPLVTVHRRQGRHTRSSSPASRDVP